MFSPPHFRTPSLWSSWSPRLNPRVHLNSSFAFASQILSNQYHSLNDRSVLLFKTTAGDRVDTSPQGSWFLIKHSFPSRHAAIHQSPSSGSPSLPVCLTSMPSSPFLFIPRSSGLTLLHASESPGLLKHIRPGPNPRSSDSVSLGQGPKFCHTNIFPETQIMLMLLVRRPHFKNHCPRVQVPITLRGNLSLYSSRDLSDLKLQKYYSLNTTLIKLLFY